MASQVPSKQQEVQEIRFRVAEVDEEERKEGAKDAMIGGNNHKTSFGQFLSDQMSKGKVYSHECVIIHFFWTKFFIYISLHYFNHFSDSKDKVSIDEKGNVGESMLTVTVKHM